MHSKIENINQTKRKIYYWNGLFDPRGLADDYDHIIEQLVSGDYGLLDLEKPANSMQQAWQALPVEQNLDAQAVQFKSYKQLINELDPATQAMTIVDKDHCFEWLGTYIQKYKKIATVLKEKLPNEDFFNNF